MKIRKFSILFLFGFLLLIFSLITIQAKSGCCSYHEGVCCECGAQSDGRVICNDGWKGSSCYYNEMEMCKNNEVITSCASSLSSTNSPCETDNDCACNLNTCGCVLKKYEKNLACLCGTQLCETGEEKCACINQVCKSIPIEEEQAVVVEEEQTTETSEEQTAVAEEEQTAEASEEQIAIAEENQIPEEEKKCEGCISDEKCLPIGYRTSDKYCDDDKSLKNQKQEDGSCNNNFECGSNVCVNSKCISGGLIQKILDFFRRLFGL